MRQLLRLAPLLLLLLLAAPSTSAAAKAKVCPKPAKTLATSKFSVVWRAGTNLNLCTVESRFTPATRRIGRWVPGTKVVLNGDNAGWTSPTRGGERISVADIGGRWLTAQRAVPATKSAASSEARVRRLVTLGGAAAWVTRDGAVAFALQQPLENPTLTAPAAGTTSATDPTGATGSTGATGPQDIPGADGPAGRARAVLVGRYPGDPAVLGASLRLAEDGGEGDECGGGTTFSLVFRPAAASGPFRAEWGGGYSTNAPACTG